MRHPQAGELIRFLFLGTIVETCTFRCPLLSAVLILLSFSGRTFAQKIAECVNSLFAHFQRGDATYEWVLSYIEHHKVWNHSRIFHVMAKDTDKIKDRDLTFCSGDGYLDAVYEPTSWAPELFYWKNRHWITVCMEDSVLTLQVWSRNRSVLDNLIQEAREFYQNRAVPPPIIMGDLSDAGWSRQSKKQDVYALPLGGSIHRPSLTTLSISQQQKINHFKSPVLIHSCDKSVLMDFIEAARIHYTDASISSVNVVVVGSGQFLENEEWYAFAGVPHRRGYLLFGDPGTGKSTTVHALVSLPRILEFKQMTDFAYIRPENLGWRFISPRSRHPASMIIVSENSFTTHSRTASF
ncbi:hypothetical protein B0H10DRAFT_1950874 [Mycena sp. CBHHK59/15]|nr:hypothetical protein B0H10DRAFT_1950874 [Mycena sp. CBHHK59/15]